MNTKTLRITPYLFAALLLPAFVSAKTPVPGCVNLLAGASPEIACSKSADDEKKWTPIYRFKSDGSYTVHWRTVFEINSGDKYAYLSLVKPEEITNLSLNSNAIKVPMKGMRYHVVGVPASYLHPGRNVLEARWDTKVKIKKDKKTARVAYDPAQVKADSTAIKLIGLTASELKFENGPVLGCAGTDFFTVSCQLNMPAEVTLHANNHDYISPKGLLHSFRVSGLHADTPYRYSLTATLPNGASAALGPCTAHTFPKRAPFSFAVLGDSRTNPDDWKRVADATLKENPLFAVFVGDMVEDGRSKHLWKKQFLVPGKNFLAYIPFYAIMGNHERSDPLFGKMFITPSGDNNWSQQIGPVLLIGINGEDDWRAGGKLALWLENTLAHSRAKFIFLASHFPAWSSGYHAKPHGVTGRVERTIVQAREVIMPLLKKYNATAMFAGHDHFYERSEPTNGVTMIVTGGAGAPLRDKVKNAAKQNPYSKVFAKKLHYCIIKVNNDACAMKVITPDGEVIDKRVWPARKTK